MMELVLVYLVLPAVLTLALLVLMVKRASRWKGNPWLYRAGFAFLAGLLSPTLLMGGHGGLPGPTIGGLVMVLTRLEWIGDLRASFIGFGSKDFGFLSAPFLVVFALAMFVPLRTARPAASVSTTTATADAVCVAMRDRAWVGVAHPRTAWIYGWALVALNPGWRIKLSH